MCSAGCRILPNCLRFLRIILVVILGGNYVHHETGHHGVWKSVVDRGEEEAAEAELPPEQETVELCNLVGPA